MCLFLWVNTNHFSKVVVPFYTPCKNVWETLSYSCSEPWIPGIFDVSPSKGLDILCDGHFHLHYPMGNYDRDFTCLLGICVYALLQHRFKHLPPSLGICKPFIVILQIQQWQIWPQNSSWTAVWKQVANGLLREVFLDFQSYISSSKHLTFSEHYLELIIFKKLRPSGNWIEVTLLKETFTFRRKIYICQGSPLLTESL